MIIAELEKRTKLGLKQSKLEGRFGNRKKKWKNHPKYSQSWDALKEMYPHETIQRKKTILDELGEKGLEQAYEAIYGKPRFFDFRKKAKIQMLRRLLNSVSSKELFNTHDRYAKSGKFKMPKRKKLEKYVWDYVENKERENVWKEYASKEDVWKDQYKYLDKRDDKRCEGGTRGWGNPYRHSDLGDVIEEMVTQLRAA